MNKNLTKEIINYYFRLVGLVESNYNFSLCTPNFLLNNKITLIDEYDVQTNHPVWGIETNINNSKVSILLSSIDDELLSIVKMDDFPAYGIKIYGDDLFFSFKYENTWLPVDISSQAKFLAGITDLFNMFPTWKEIKNHDNIYNSLLELVDME